MLILFSAPLRFRFTYAMPLAAAAIHMLFHAAAVALMLLFAPDYYCYFSMPLMLLLPQAILMLFHYYAAATMPPMIAACQMPIISLLICAVSLIIFTRCRRRFFFDGAATFRRHAMPRCHAGMFFALFSYCFFFRQTLLRCCHLFAHVSCFIAAIFTLRCRYTITLHAASYSQPFTNVHTPYIICNTRSLENVITQYACCQASLLLRADAALSLLLLLLADIIFREDTLLPKMLRQALPCCHALRHALLLRYALMLFDFADFRH